MLKPVQAASLHHWYQLTWVDWLTVAGIPLALIGLFFTWQQARNAASAAKAAQEAVQRTEQTIRAKQLAILVPLLRWTVTELESAIAANSHSAARRSLDSWRWQAGNAQGVLGARDPAEFTVLQSLQQSVGLARTAGTALMKEDRLVATSCSKAHQGILVACDQLSVWLGRNSTEA